jgi:8-oxo-dGTP diphosphatase
VSDLEKGQFRMPTVDIIIEKGKKIILIKRNTEPFKGKLAIPGGFVEAEETVEQAALREAKEETGLEVKLKGILGVYSDPKRDPRGRVTAIVFISKPVGGELKASSDAAKAEWVEIDKIDFNNLAFDHSKILRDYLKWKKEKETYWSSK